MKQSNLLKALVALTVVAAVGCSSSKKKDDAGMAEAPKVPDSNLTSNNVYDAGTYSEKEDVSDLRARGGKFFETIPAEKFYSVDREKYAPVGKLFYVIADDDQNNTKRCIPAKYTMLDNKKKLVVYSKTTVPNTYCIFQKASTNEPAGFVIYIKDGGMCKPAVITSKVDDSKKTVSQVELYDKIVSMRYCFENTTSLGMGKGAKMDKAGTAASGDEEPSAPAEKRKKSKKN